MIRRKLALTPLTLRAASCDNLCMTNSPTDIIIAIARLADLDFETACCELEPICDAIMTTPALTIDDARAMIACADRIDETESSFAAEIRDCIRDNFELEGI